MKNIQPFFFENSKLPKVLSLFAPIEISAISLFGFVFSTGTMSEITKRHETIHFQQQIETAMIGFLFIYLWDYAKNIWIHKMDKETAYFNLRAEKEAYFWHEDETYLTNRKRWAWLTTEWKKEESKAEEPQRTTGQELTSSEEDTDDDWNGSEHTEAVIIINQDNSNV
jgi:hypothetical protein